MFPHLTVAQNIGFGRQMQGRPKAEVTQAVDRMLALVELEAIAGGRARRPTSFRAASNSVLARALAPAPKVLLVDEPLSALDLKLRKEMQIELKRLDPTGITFVFVTHDQEEALTMSDRIAGNERGQAATGRHPARRPAPEPLCRGHRRDELSARHMLRMGA